MEEKVKSDLTKLENAVKIFDLAGLNNYCKVGNNSFVYKNGNIGFVVQIIKNLGIFIEYEEDESMKALSPDQKFRYMVNITKNLGLKLGNDYMQESFHASS